MIGSFFCKFISKPVGLQKCMSLKLLLHLTTKVFLLKVQETHVCTISNYRLTFYNNQPVELRNLGKVQPEAFILPRNPQTIIRICATVYTNSIV